LFGQRAQQGDPALAGVDDAERLKPLRPGGQRSLQKGAGDLPVLGQLHVHQAGQGARRIHLLDLQAVEEAPQGVGQLQGGRGVQIPRQQMFVGLDQSGQLQPPAQGIDGRGQACGQIAGLEGRLAGVEIA